MLPAGAGAGNPTPITTLHLRRCFYGDYMADMDETGSRPYQEILNPEVRMARAWDRTRQRTQRSMSPHSPGPVG